MGMRNHTDPYGGLNPLVDRVIGPKAYDFVKFVALRMGFIQKAASEPYTRLRLLARTTGLVTSLVFPPTVLLENMVDSAVWIVDPVTGSRCNADSGYFNVIYTTMGATISIKPEAPLSLQNAEIMWFLTAMEVYRAPIA